MSSSLSKAARHAGADELLAAECYHGNAGASRRSWRWEASALSMKHLLKRLRIWRRRYFPLKPARAHRVKHNDASIADDYEAYWYCDRLAGGELR